MKSYFLRSCMGPPLSPMRQEGVAPALPLHAPCALVPAQKGAGFGRVVREDTAQIVPVI